MPKQEKTFASPLMQFVVEKLRADRNVTYRDVADAAEKRGLKLVPIVFGRAKLALGMVKAGQGQAKRRAKESSGRGPGRPPGKGRKPGRPAGPGRAETKLDGFEGIVTHVRGLEREAADLRARLSRIADLAAN